MRRVLGLGIVVLGLASGASAQTLLERAELAQAPAFQQRIGVAAMQTALAVMQEDEATLNHAARLRLAAWTLNEPEFMARRLAAAAAAVASVNAQSTDAQLSTLVTNQWTTLALLFTTQRQ